MKSLTFMVIAGEPSGDLLAAELVQALRAENARRRRDTGNALQPLCHPFAPRFFGAGGARMAEAGVELVFDMTRHAIVGVIDVLKSYRKFRRFFQQLLKLACVEQPDAIICVDFSGFNRRFAIAVRRHIRARRGSFNNWNPKIIQYVSPQVWASRSGRARSMERDLNLLLSIIPFEKDWFARQAPRLRVEPVGHPIMERYASNHPTGQPMQDLAFRHDPPRVLLLPGSRQSELKRHLPAMLKAAALIETDWRSVQFFMVLPNAELETLARAIIAQVAQTTGHRYRAESTGGATSIFRRSGLRNMKIQTGDLADALGNTDTAIASTGTITMECAYFGVPTVAIYKTSWSNYQIAKQLIQVKHLAMPNLLAGETVMPEFLQNAATPENIAHETLELLEDGDRRRAIRLRLRQVMESLGSSGANQRAAQAIFDLWSIPSIGAP